MERSIRTSWLSLLVFVLAGVRARAADTAATDDARVRRGVEVRKILLDALEQVHAAGGAWPERLALAPGAPKLLYSKPETVADPDPRIDEAVASAAVVLHEPPEQFPAGVWVGYADGHLEFAPDARTLAECRGQISILRDAVARHGTLFEYPPGPPRPNTRPLPAMPGGTVTLKVLDPDGKPVAGADVGVFCQRGDRFGPEDVGTYFSYLREDRKTSRTGADGTFAVRPEYVFTKSRFAHNESAPLYVVREDQGLVALLEVQPADFNADRARDVRLQPGCRVRGEITCLALLGTGSRLERCGGFAFLPGRVRLRVQFSDFDSPRFEYLLPPGDHGIHVRGTDTYSPARYVRIEPGRREMKLQIDVQPYVTSELIGKPAPELRQIKGWKNGGPVALADLRGKVVIVDFWGHWCGPCIAAMPELMKLHDAFKAKGLVVVAVHDDTAESIGDMDRKLERARKEAWNGRDLPFLVALDGGGETRIRGTSMKAAGATTAAYGITQFPTTLLIGRDGKVVRKLKLYDPAEHADIEKRVGELLEEKKPGS